MVKRRIIAVTMILVMLLSLTGCAADSSGSTVRETIPESTYVAEANRMAPPVSAADAFAGGSGTPENPYQIETAEQLALLAKYVNEANKDFSKAHYVQTADIVMNNTSDLENWGTQAPKWSWTPIGIQYLNDFQGYYNGAGYIISGMYIYHVDDETDDPNTDINDIGLFGSVYEGAVENVTLRDSYVYAAGIDNVGGIVGDASYSVVTNCVNGASVTAMNVPNVGGVCGFAGNETSLDKCHNTGAVWAEESDLNGTVSAGGVCGQSWVSVTNSSNKGAVLGEYVGGICGSAGDLVENCQNFGEIHGPEKVLSNVGGIVGNSSKEIRNCWNYGAVSGYSSVGGIVGSFSNFAILEDNIGTAVLKQCVNSGEVTGQYDVGGIIGITTVVNGTLTVSDCTNSATVTGSGDNSGVGGIVGCLSGGGAWNDGQGLTLENCHNSGNVTHQYNAGGIAGECTVPNAPVIIENCSNEGSISAVNGSGGILGQISPGNNGHVIRNNKNSGKVTAEVDGGGIVGRFLGFALGVDEPKEVQILKCSNSSEISGKHIGGIVGAGWDGNGRCRIDGCLNEGRIFGEDATALGGILGVDIATHLADGKRAVFYITHCANMGPVIYGAGDLPFDTNIQYRTEFEDHIDVEAATGFLLGGNCMGGIAGGVFQSAIEDCVNCGEIRAEEGTAFMVSLMDFAPFDTDLEEKLMAAGAICGMYHFREDVHTAEIIGIRNCTYVDTACKGYSEVGLFEGVHTITDVYAVSENQARELASELTK